MIRIIMGCVFFFAAMGVMAQNTLSGKVLDSLTHEPVQYANVFFANTSIGSVTNLNGVFIIRDFPSGKFDLTVSFVGYTTQQLAINFSGGNFTITVFLAQEVIQLNEILVTPDTSGRRRNFEIFKGKFLGESKNASHTRIVNPRNLYFYSDPNDHLLTGHARKPIEIENRALGYKVYYLLHNFQFDYKTNELSYFGIPRFETLEPKNKAELQRFQKERKRAYYGSFRHFIQTLKQNKLQGSGFEAYYFFRKPNPKRPDEAFLNERIKYWGGKFTGGFVIGTKNDSLSYYVKLRDMPTHVDSVGSRVVNASELFEPGSNDVLEYQGLLFVTFKEREDSNYAWGRPAENLQQSVIHFSGNQLRLYDNGYYEDVHDVILEGYLGWSEKICELLPLEYQPLDD